MYRIKIGIVLLLATGLMFGCGGDDVTVGDGHLASIDPLSESYSGDDVTVGDGHDHVHGDAGDDFDTAVSNLGLVFDDPAAAGRPSPSFSAEIAPILTKRCAIAECHVVDGPHDIDLRTYDTLMKGGDEGAIVLVGNARESEIVEEIAEGKMPPEGPPLDAAQIQLIIDWINEGAKNN